MLTVGRASLIIALAIALYGIVALIYGARANRREWVDSGRRATYALTAFVLVAFALVEAAFLRADLTWQLVANNSSTTTPLFYRATGMWSSQEGSLLLWLTLGSIWSSVAMFTLRDRAREVVPYAGAVLLGIAAFFASLLVFLESPFVASNPVPVEGVGLNPLLRHPAMMIHPPMLYSGYTLFAVPFAFAVGALITRRLDANWIRLTRRFALGAWVLLGTGIMLGARWSYSELGWGGYWGWDPVENASLLPWLTGTAFLHSVMIQEKRGMLKVWNVSLILATGILAILGTFLVRSGVLESIHAFGASTLGIPFLVLIGVMMVGSIWLVTSRAADLRSDHHLDSLLSREAVFLFNNLLLVGLCFVVFWGTMFPLISEAFTGRELSVGPPWYNRYTVPIAILLVLMTGIGPVIAWRRATARNLQRNMLGPALFAGVAMIALIAFTPSENSIPALLMFVFGAFALAIAAQEFSRGIRARRIATGQAIPAAAFSLVTRNRRRYGGYIAHVGIVVLLLGAAASSAFKETVDVTLSPGETTEIGGYQVTYVRPTGELRAASNGRLERIDFGTDLLVRRDGETVGELHAEKSYHPGFDPNAGAISRFFEEGNATSEVALDAGWRRDFWAAVSPDIERMRPHFERGDQVFAQADELDPAMREALMAQALDGLVNTFTREEPRAVFRIIVSPFVWGLWVGALIVIAGALIALWPERRGSRSDRAKLAAQVGRDVRTPEEVPA